nr:retrovirus-related Pol polyprotein from transposon TNT 1-94 [Tanacetum cinerariifolium]
MNPRSGSAAGYGGAQNKVRNVNPGQARPVKCYNCNGTGHILLFLAGGHDNAFDDVDEQPVQDLALNVDNVFQADDCNAFDYDVDEAPTIQTMFMANLSSADPITDEARPSYDLDILSEVQDHDHYQDATCTHHEEHAMHDSVQLDHVVNSHVDYTSDSNMIPYDQYVKDNEGVNPRGGNAARYGGVQNRVGNVNPGQARPGQARPVKFYNCNENGVALDVKQLLFLAGGQDNAFDNDVDEQPVQDLALNMDNVFQADDCDAFDSDVDEAPTEQTMFMANLSSADPVTDEARPSYDSDILSEDNEVPVVHSVVHSDVSSVPNDAFMMIYNDMCESHTQFVSNPSRNIVVKSSLTTKLDTYKEHVELYEQRAKFELTEREQKINEQLRLVIYDRNFKEETLKKELHSIKLQLASTINHNKSMVEEVTFLKKDFKQKENKYLEDFLDMKSLKEKVKDRLIKQDQSLQIVHMLCRPKPHYNELNKVAIGYKNPLCLTRAKQVQPTLYNGHEIIKDNHTPAIVHNAEDTLEIAEITRKKMNDKMNDPKCVTRKVKIAPHDFSKENFLATFTPQKQLTLEPIFWSNDLMKLKSEALKERTKVSRPIKALTVYPPNTHAKLVPKVLPTKSQLKYQNLKDSIRNNPPTPDKDTPNFDSVFVIGKMQASLQGNDNVIRQLKKQLSQLQVTRSNTDRTLKVRTTDSQITKLTNQVTNLQAQNDLFRAEYDKIKQHYKELYDSINIIRAKHIEQTNVPVPPSTGVNSCPNASKSQPKSHVKPNRISPAKGVNKLPVEDQPSTNKSHVKTSNRVDSSSRLKCTFIGTVRFENDHFGAIMGYGDYVIGDSVISRKHSCYVRDMDGVELIKGSRGSNLYIISIEDMMKSSPKYILVIVDDYSRFTWVKFLRSKDETPEVIIKFITQIQVGLNKTVRYVRTDNDTEFINHTLTEYYERIGIFHQKTVPRTPQQNGVVKRRNRTLVKAAQTMQIFFKAPMFLWVEAVATACYTQNRSLIHTRHHKTPYELVHNKKPDLIFLRVFGALYYPTNDSEDLGKLQPTADTGIFVGYTPSRKGYRIYNKRTRRIMETIHVQFDELTEPMAPVHLGSTSSSQLSRTPSSTTIDKDAPSFSISPSSSALQSHSLNQGVVDEPNYMEDHTVAPVDITPFVNVFAPEPHFEASTSGDVIPTGRYIVPTGRVIVLAGRYIVPTGSVIVATGRYIVPTGYSPPLTGRKIYLEWDPRSGSDHNSDNASIHNEAPNNHQQPNIQPQIITTVIQSGNSLKRTGRGSDGGLIILPSTTAEEHLAVKRESKARTTLLQSIPDDHITDFHYMDDARDIWNAVKARFGGNAESKKIRKSMLKQEFSEFRISETKGFHKGYDRMQKILSQINQLNAKPDTEEINLRFLRALPSSWSQLALTLKNQSATSTSKKMPYGDSLNISLTTTYFIPSNSKTGSYRTDLEQIEKLDLEEMDLKWQWLCFLYKFEQKAERKIDFDKKESARFNKQKVRCYKCQQRGYFARECRAKAGNDKQRYSSFKVKEIGKKEEDSKALITVDTLVDWSNHDSNEVIATKEFGIIAGCDSADVIIAGANKLYNLINGANSEEANTPDDAGEFALMGVTSEVHNCPFGCDNKYNELTKMYDALNKQNNEYFIQDQAYKNSLKTLENQKRVLQSNHLILEDKIRVLTIELENTSNLLKHYERINVECETVKKDLQKKLDNHLVQTKKWRTSSKNLYRLINSSMSVRTKVGLGFTDYISQKELGWNDSAFSVFTTTSEDVEGRPTFHSDSGLKSSEHKPTDSSCASTFSVSTSVNEAENESNVGKPIKEPISVQDLTSFTYNSSNKNEHSSRTSCNKNGSFNKKA